MRKINELSLAETRDFAQRHYADKITVFGETFFAHAENVARQAEHIAIKLYGDLRADYFSESTKDNVAAAVHCAMLHDVLNISSCAFEQIAEATNVQIAAMVADISRDYRLIETKRDMEFRGRVSQSPLGAQIVVVADAICTAKKMLLCLADNSSSVIPRLKKTISQLDGDLLSIQAANKYCTLRLFCHGAKNMLSEISQKIKERRQQAKIAKYVAQSAQNVRDKIAAREAEKSVCPRQKKKEPKYARKQKRT